jgi:ABC-type multidrug transport system permease subunit
MIGFVGAMIWIGILFGSLVKTPEGVQGLGFGVLFPLTFVASTFVPIDNMPKVLQTIAAWNPVTTLADSVRVLFGNPISKLPAGFWSIDHPIAYTVIWIVAIVVVCAPLAVRAYQRSIAD